jgi:hypothetical protein
MRLNSLSQSRFLFVDPMPFEMFKMFNLLIKSRVTTYLGQGFIKDSVFVRSKPSYLVKTFFVPSRDLIKLVLGLLDLLFDFQDVIFFL